MNYPLELLPNPAYKAIDCDLSDCFLIRFTNTNNIDEIWDKETNTIKVEQIYFPSERVSDLSMSLLGIYTKDHIFLEFTEVGKGKYLHYCAPNENIEAPVYQTDFTLNNNRHYWCIQIKNLANQDFDYSKGNETCTATCLVLHTPMKWNYWHFSLRWKIDDGLLEELNEKEWKKLAKKIGHSVRTTIVHFARIDEPQHQPLPKECYCTN